MQETVFIRYNRNSKIGYQSSKRLRVIEIRGGIELTTDISLRAAHAIQRQGKHLFSPLDSKAFVCLIGAVVFALEEVGAVRIEPAEPAHHGRILPRKMPEEAHLQAFYLRAVDKSVVAFFLDCTAEGETLQAEKDAFFHALASEPVKTDNEAHLARLQQGETEDPLLFSLLSASRRRTRSSPIPRAPGSAPVRCAT